MFGLLSSLVESLTYAQRQFLLTVFLLIFMSGIGIRAQAGELIIYNLGDRPAVCSVDGYAGKDNKTNEKFAVEPGGKLNLPPNLAATPASITWVDCGGGLRTRSMYITPDGPDRLLFLNGHQKRTMNVVLYSSIPTDAAVGYGPLVRGLILRFQAKFPDILLNLVLDPVNIDLYDFDNLKNNILGSQGFDVAELDTVFLEFLVQNNLITPAQITGDEPWSVAKEAATINGTLYAVPSWLCSDFLFATDSSLTSTQTFDQLIKYLGRRHSDGELLVGDLDGSWTIPAIYIQSFVQMHNSATAAEALKIPVDSRVIDRMVEFSSTCKSGNSYPCIDGTYHSARDGSVEQTFSTGHADLDLGFSERSFYIKLFEQTPNKLSLIPMPWGDTPTGVKLIYSDAFVTNKQTCGNPTCQSDSAALAAFFTGADTKSFVAFANDLAPGAPPRHLLVATKPFYTLKTVKDDPVYSQLLSTILAGKMLPYLNTFTPKLKYELLSAICPVLRAKSPQWSCKVPKMP